MMDNHRRTLLKSIADTVADYRYGSIPQISPQHVDEWLDQFNASDQPVILEEMDRILKQTYFSSGRVKTALESLAASPKILGSATKDEIRRTKFLAIQEKGNSQRALLDILKSIVYSKYGLSLAECGENPRRYIYLDDALFTGNRVKYDVLHYLPSMIPHKPLFLCFMVAHSQGQKYVRDALRTATQRTDTTVEIASILKIPNIRNDRQMYECLWPRDGERTEAINEYLDALREECDGKGWSGRKFREAGFPNKEGLFSSPERRDIVEHAFLRAGAKIWATWSRRGEAISMRPMGFEKLPSLGFGSLVITHLNIANNCPLALWWGYGNWIPLFERNTNSSEA